MLNWVKYHIYELNIFVAGWCTFATLDCLLKESWMLAAVNGSLIFINIKLAKMNK